MILAWVTAALAGPAQLSPPPQHVRVGTELLRAERPLSVRIEGDHDPVAQARVRRTLEAAGFSLRWQKRPLSVALEPQAYELEVDGWGLVVRAPDAGGLHNAATTLAQWVDPGELAHGHVRDAPLHQARWVHVHLPDPTPEHPTAELLPLLEAFTAQALDLKFNGLVVELSRAFRFESHPELAAAGASDLASLVPIAEALAARGASFVPLLSLFCHQEQLMGPAHPEWMLTPADAYPMQYGKEGLIHWPAVADVDSLVVQEATTRILDEVVDLFSPSAVHIGHDECGALSFVPRTRDREVPERFTRSVRLGRDHLASRGVDTLIWADMLLDSSSLPGTAHGSGRKAPTFLALGELPRDLILVDWQYQAFKDPDQDLALRSDMPSTAHLARAGFTVMGATRQRTLRTPQDWKRHAPALQHSRDFSAHVASLGGQGMILTHWVFSRRFAWDLQLDWVGSLVATAPDFWGHPGGLPSGGDDTVHGEPAP
jgi:hypothetical protein